MDPDRLERFRSALNEFRQIVAAVNADRKLWFNKPNLEWWRLIMRECFAHNEIMVYQIGRMLLAAHEANLIQLSVADLSLLNGEQYSFSENGKAVLRDDLIRSHTILLFTVRLCTDYCGFSQVVNKRNAEWKNYKIALRIRDNATHPKSFSDYELTGDSRRIVASALTWSFNLIGALQNSVRGLGNSPIATI